MAEPRIPSPELLTRVKLERLQLRRSLIDVSKEASSGPIGLREKHAARGVLDGGALSVTVDFSVEGGVRGRAATDDFRFEASFVVVFAVKAGPPLTDADVSTVA